MEIQILALLLVSNVTSVLASVSPSAKLHNAKDPL